MRSHKIHFLISTICLFVLYTSSLASEYDDDQYVIEGVVLDYEKGIPLPYSSVSVKNSWMGATTNGYGEFRIDLKDNKPLTLSFTYIGFEKLDTLIEPGKLSQPLRISLKENHFNLSEVVVTGTRSYKTLKEAPVITRVISARDIQQNDVVNFRELLELELPGLEFTRMGGTSAINMQGMGGKYILFLVDGERLAGEIRENTDYNRINMENIERIEVVKGAASTLYGSSAVGGVVNIITKTPERPVEINIHSRNGGMGENHMGINVGGKWNKWTTHTAISYRNAKSYELQNSSYLVRSFEDGTTHTDNQLRVTHIDGSLNRTIDQKFQYRINPAITTELKLGYFDNERFNAGLEGQKRRDFYQDYNGTARFNWQVNPGSRLEATYHYDNYSKYDYFLILDKRESNYISVIHNPRLLYNQKIGTRHELTSGIEFLAEPLTSFMFSDDVFRNTHSYVAYIQDDLTLGKRWNIISGLRYDHHSAFGGHLSPKLSAMYKAGAMTFRGGYAAGYRSPNTRELYTDWDHRGIFRLIGNENLRPETSHNYNLSAEFWHDKLNASVVGHYNQINNKIQHMWNLQQDSAFHQNIDRATIWGADLNLTWRVFQNVTLRAAYAYVKDMAEEDGRNLSATRPHSLALRTEYRLRIKSVSNTISLGLKALDDITVYNFDNSTEQYTSINYPGYQIWRASISSKLPYGFTATATVDNIFDYKASVVTFNSSISPGRLFYFGLSFDIDRLFHKLF